MARGAKRVAGGLGACLLLALCHGGAAAQVALPWAVPPREWLGIPAGGLDTRDAGDLRLESLVLTLAPDRVKASYRLANDDAAERQVELGFPFPSIEQAPSEGPPLSHGFSDATLVLDGAAQPLAGVRLHVFMREVDVTDALEAAGVPVQALLSADPAEQPREQRRAMEQALVDAGIAVDPAGWSVAVEPVWRVTLPPHRAVLVTLAYTPYPGRSVDQVPGDERLEDLADLSGYCADEQPGLLDWMRDQVARRAQADRRRLAEHGLSPAEAAANAIGEIELLDLGFVWRGGGWPETYPQVSLLIDAGEGRAAFCLPSATQAGPARRGDDGVYRATLTDPPADGRLDVLFLR